MSKKKNKDSQKPLRITRQRRVILEELKKVTSHPTADVVHKLVRRRLPNISLATVYRNLDILSERGLIQKLESGGRQRRYDGNTDVHYHVRCIRCGRVDDVPVGTIPAIEKALSGDGGFKIIGYRLEFVGICPQCQKSERHGK